MHLPHLYTTPRIRVSAVGPLYKQNVTEPGIHTKVCLQGMPLTLGFKLQLYVAEAGLIAFNIS